MLITHVSTHPIGQKAYQPFAHIHTHTGTNQENFWTKSNCTWSILVGCWIFTRPFRRAHVNHDTSKMLTSKFIHKCLAPQSKCYVAFLGTSKNLHTRTYANNLLFSLVYFVLPNRHKETQSNRLIVVTWSLHEYWLIGIRLDNGWNCEWTCHSCTGTKWKVRINSAARWLLNWQDFRNR